MLRRKVNIIVITLFLGSLTGQDITPPTISSVTSTTANGSYKKDSEINITLNFVDENNDPEEVTLTDAKLVIELETGSTDRTISINTIASATSASATYTVQKGDSTSALSVITISLSATGNSPALKDAAGNAMIFFLPTTNLEAAHTIAVDGIAPAAPTGLSATAGNSLVTLSWNINSETDFGKYRIYEDKSSSPTTAIDSTLTVDDISKTITGRDNDTTYYYRLAALDTLGNISDYSSEVSAVPFSRPAAGAIRDGTSDTSDVYWWNSRSTLSFNWNSFQDNGSVSYQYAVGTSLSDLNNTVDWTVVGDTSVTLTNLNLIEGFTYYLSARGTDFTSKSDTATSNGITMDLTNPTPGVVNDGSTETGTDLTYIDTAEVYFANWTGFVDTLSSGVASGVASYKYAIGTSPGDTNVVSWTDIVIQDSLTHSGLALAEDTTSLSYTGLVLMEDTTYYFSVIATDSAGNSSDTVSSNGVTVDLTPPTKGEIVELKLDDFVKGDFTDRVWTTDSTQFVVYWWGFADTLSGIDHYEIALLDSDSTIVLWGFGLDWTPLLADSVTIMFGLSLEDDQIYTIALRCFDVAGNFSTAYSNGIYVDLSPPYLKEYSTDRILVEDSSLVKIIFSEPIDTVHVAASGERTETVNFVSDIKQDTLFISIAPPLVSMDSLTYFLTGATDTRELVNEDTIIVGFNTRLLGDYDDNLEIDIGDITQFVALWPNTDIAPVTGDPPYFFSTPDEVTDLRDAMAFARLWRWSNEPMDTSRTAAFLMGEPLNTRIISGGFSITLPRIARSGEMEIQSQSRIRLTNGETSENGLFLSRLNASGKHQIINFGLFREPAEGSDPELIFSVDDPAEKIDLSYRFFGSSGDLISSGSVTLFDSPLPTQFALHQNHPNPFNPVTTIAYDIPEPTYVEIAIYDLLGRKVRTLVSKEMSPGFHSAVWNGKDDRGRLVASGMFIVRMTSNSFMNVRKMLMLK